MATASPNGHGSFIQTQMKARGNPNDDDDELQGISDNDAPDAAENRVERC